MDYVELSMTVADEETAEIIVAELADYPFESFSAEGRDLKAYIPEKELAECRADVDKMLGRYGIGGQKYTLIGQRNWNAVWESDFEPVEIDGRVIVRAPFHEPRPEYGDMELVIMPNMSFGTGHHVTTRLMVETMLGMELKAKQVLDMGCGTGVLAILAAKSGAAHVDAVDIDEMAFGNCADNIAANNVAEGISPILGDVGAVEGRHYDVIVANINRNILLHDMPSYAAMLNAGGRIVMSGFLTEDAGAISEAARTLDMQEVQRRENEGWTAIEFVKAE